MKVRLNVSSRHAMPFLHGIVALFFHIFEHGDMRTIEIAQRAELASFGTQQYQVKHVFAVIYVFPGRLHDRHEGTIAEQNAILLFFPIQYVVYPLRLFCGKVVYEGFSDLRKVLRRFAVQNYMLGLVFLDVPPCACKKQSQIVVKSASSHDEK